MTSNTGIGGLWFPQRSLHYWHHARDDASRQIVSMMNWTCNDWSDSERDSLKVGPTHGDKLNHYQDPAAVRKITHCGENLKNKISLLKDTTFIMCFWESIEKDETFRHTQKCLYWWVLYNYSYIKKTTSIM